MRYALALALLTGLLSAEVGIEPVVSTSNDGTQQVWYRINTGAGFLYDAPLPGPGPRPAGGDTGVLWVDRNHRFGICQATGISNDGHHIFANWYLNAERASYYRTLGDEVPVWEAPGKYPWAYNGQQIGVSRDGSVLGMSSSAGAVKWSNGSPYPDWAFPYSTPVAGFTKVSRNGNRVVTVQDGKLTWLRSSDGRVVWAADVPEPTRLQGLDLSDNGHVVAVTVYDSCVIFDQGARRGAVPIGTSNCGTQYAAALSGDGRMLATGDFYGSLKLYSWDSTGQSYVLKWSAQVGTPWVAGVAVSRDGARVACGTGYGSGKLCVFDSSSSTPVMVYQNYGVNGAYVSSVALSANGSRVAAASWGDIATSGDFRVLTVHNVGDTTPLVAVTRDDEPGSLFAVDISDDGQFVTAGGKAVHAQQMGNGGEVYAGIVGAFESRNVGTAAALAPGRFMQVGSPANVAWRVANYGDSAQTFYSHVLIASSADSVLRHDSVPVTALAPKDTADLSAPTFTPAAYDMYSFRYYTALAGDQYAGDDTMAAQAKCFHDGTPILVRPPNAEQTIGADFTPRVAVLNNGSYNDDMNLGLSILDSAGTVIYTQSLATGLIPADDTVAVTFPALVISTAGRYTAMAVVSCPDDFYPANDTLRVQFLVTYEIMYDDGGWEAFYWVGRQDNDKFYVRFTPTITPPYSLRHGRFYVNMANTPFDYVMVCPDASGMPDTANPLQVVNNVRAPQAPGWADFDLDITRRNSDDVWLICHWPPGSPAVGIGADATAPIDLRSYFSSNQDPFRQWTTHDWMMRLLQSVDVGIESPEIAPVRLSLSAPAISSRHCTIGYSVPSQSRVRLLLYDAAGRLQARLLDGARGPGSYRQTLAADRLAPGVYFVKLLLPDTDQSVTAKLLLVD